MLARVAVAAGDYTRTLRLEAAATTFREPDAILRLANELPELERDLGHARLVVYWTARDGFIDNTSLDDRIPELDKYLISRYRAVGAVNAYRLLVRN